VKLASTALCPDGGPGLQVLSRTVTLHELSPSADGEHSFAGRCCKTTGEEKAMRWLLTVLLSVVAMSVASPAAADAPTAFPFEFVFDDVNPCTGDIHTVTIAGTTFVHFHGSRIVAYSERTITTSPTGFVGHGTDSNVLNGQVEMFRLADILTNPAGDRIRARFVIVIDVSTGTVRVEKGELTCLGP
jgi:hypothetical protein